MTAALLGFESWWFFALAPGHHGRAVPKGKKTATLDVIIIFPHRASRRVRPSRSQPNILNMTGHQWVLERV